MPTNQNELLEAYLNVDEAFDPVVIPGQHSFTFISKKTRLPHVWKWDSGTKEVHQYTDLPDRILSVHHSHRGDKTIVGMDQDGNEKQQFYLLMNDGADVEELVVSEDHFHQFGGWAPDDHAVSFTSNRRHQGYFDVYIYDFSKGEEELIYEVDAQCTPVCWTKDGKSLVISVAETNIDQSFYLLDIETKKLVKLGDENESARYASLQLTDNSEEGFILTDEYQNTLSVHHFSLDAPIEMNHLFSSRQWDIEELKLSPNEDKLAYTTNEGGISTLGVYSLVDQTHQKITSLPRGVYQSLNWLDNNELVLGVKSAHIPGDIWKVSITKDDAERLTWVGEDKDISHLWTQPELCHFTSFDGLEVPYFLYGKQRENQPAVVYVHGGPEHQIRETFNPVIQFLAHLGYAVIAPNVRGSMGYGRDYVKLDDVRKRMDAVTDLKWLVQDLGEKHGVNLNKVGIIGRSYGGFMVLAALTHHPQLWAAGVDIVGISHFKSFLENTGPWRRKLREFEYGSLHKDVDFFEEIAPMNHTEKITAPLLVFHGRNDTRVPVSEAEQLTANLQKQNKHVELHIFEDEGHQTEKLENHIFMNTKTISFFERFLS